MSKRSEPLDLLTVELHASKWLTILTLCIYSVAMISVWRLFSFVGAMLIGVLLGAHAQFILQRDCWRTLPQSVIKCQAVSLAFWRLTTTNGKTFLVKMHAKPYRSRWLSILAFRTMAQQRLYLVIAHDALSNQNYTRLISRLWYWH